MTTFGSFIAVIAVVCVLAAIADWMPRTETPILPFLAAVVMAPIWIPLWLLERIFNSDGALSRTPDGD